MSVQSQQMTIETFLKVLKRRLPVIVLCTVVVAAVAVAYSLTATRKYTATASLVFNSGQVSQQLAGLQATNNANEATAIQATDVQLVELGNMAAKTASQLSTVPGALSAARDLTEASVRRAISATAQGESNIVNVAAEASSPRLAAAIANTYVRTFVDEQQNSNQSYYASALQLVQHQVASLTPAQRNSAAGLALEERLQSLSLLASLKGDTVQIAQLATVPTSPSSPKTARNITLGVIAGLLLGLAIALIWERLDRRIRDADELAEVYGLPLLGVVAESRTLGQANAGKQKPLSPQDAEAFQMAWAHLRYFNVDHEMRLILLTSAAPGDGKTTVSQQLASAAVRRGARVLLVEADLRRPVLANRLDLGAPAGLAEVLVGIQDLQGAICHVPLSDGSPGANRGSLDVLVGGPTLPPNPGELLASNNMRQLLADARAEYDVVIIDTPPLAAVSDAFPLLQVVDGVVIVGRMGRNHRDIAARLRDILASTDAHLLGVIANGVSVAGTAYGYGYGYAPTENSATQPAELTQQA